MSNILYWPDQVFCWGFTFPCDATALSQKLRVTSTATDVFMRVWNLVCHRWLEEWDKHTEAKEEQ